MPERQPIRRAMAPDPSDTTLVGSWCHAKARSPLDDYSTGGNDMTLNGSGYYGEQNSFVGDGASAYLRSVVASFRGTDTAGTIECWVAPAAVTIYQVLFCSGDEATNTYYVVIRIQNTNQIAVVQNNNDTESTLRGGTALVANRWYHVVVVSDGSAYTIYIDGSPETLTVVAGANNGDWFADTANRDNITIGAYRISAAGHYSNAEIAAVNVYSEAKTADWVANRYAACVPDSDLVLWVPGDGRDYSRYQRSTTASGGPILGRRMSFDGTDDKLDAGDVGNIRTVAMWVNPATTTQELMLIDAGKDIMVSAGTVTYTGVTATATYVNGAASTTLAAGVWQHLVCVLSADHDANNCELANDGANYGQAEIADWRCYNAVKTADWAKLDYLRTRGDY